MIMLITGIVALANGTRTWLRLNSRTASIVVTATAAAVLLVTGSVSRVNYPLPAQGSGRTAGDLRCPAAARRNTASCGLGEPCPLAASAVGSS